MRENISADIPLSLRQADELLSAYGRWAADRPSLRRCGSAEGNYRPGKGEAQEAKRAPRDQLLKTDDAMRCQRALARVPHIERIILAVLYIPRRLPAAAQLRILKIPPRMSRERHLSGLRMFDNISATLRKETA